MIMKKKLLDTSKTLNKQRSSHSMLLSISRFPLCITVFFVFLVFLLQLLALKHPSSHSPAPPLSSPAAATTSWSLVQQWGQLQTLFNSQQVTTNCTRQLMAMLTRLRDSVTFLPLKDLRFSNSAMQGHTWFISSLNDTVDVDGADDSEYLYFPSEASKRRILCLEGSDRSDGGRNSYGLAWSDALPSGATVLDGLTYVSDTYYDYGNIWHGLSAVFPFVGWYHRRGECEAPRRWVLYHWGELRLRMGPWIQALMVATFGEGLNVERFEDGPGSSPRPGPTCFERAVVFRHNMGRMGREKRVEVFDLLRCKARAHCGVGPRTQDEERQIGLTLLLRTGPRAFQNKSAVVGTFQRVCAAVEGCRLTVAWSDNLSFCEQVRLMSSTDVFASPHGAQLTNMLFMDKESSVMEFYPRGWLSLAGVGQYVYKWEASWSGMRHQGAWRDPEQGQECPTPDNKRDCFTFYKAGKISLQNHTFLAQWIMDVLQQERVRRAHAGPPFPAQSPPACPCT